MRRLARDAALIAATALAVWFVRGEAEDVTPVGYGESFQLVCIQGEITRALAFVDEFDGRVSLSWRAPMGDANVARHLSGSMSFTGCTAYPDLTAR